MDAYPDVDGLVTLASNHDFPTTLSRLTNAMNARQATIFAVIDHAAGAEAAGLALAPTTVVVFGDPRAGTTLMQVRQTAGIDLPLKILVWRDEADAVWLGYNDPAWIARRHGLDLNALPNIAGMAEALAAFTSAAAGD
jgi:uncharacterized protein (DUF302 family)